MKKVLSIVFAAALLLIGTNASAQFSLGLGYTNSAQKLDAAGVEKSVNMNGFYVGGDYNMVFSKYFGIAPGVYYHFSTGVANDIINLPSVGGNLEGRLDDQYIDIPVNFNISIPVQNNRAFIYAGPTFSIGLSSLVKADASILGINIKGDVMDLFDKDIFNRFDVMVGGGFGFDFNNFIRVTAGYNWGVINRLNTGSPEISSGDSVGTILSNLGKYIKENASLERGMVHVGVALLF